MLICSVSDIHGIYLPKIPPCDLLIVAGDITRGQNSHNWIEFDFADWLNDQPARHKVGVAGNHDLDAEQLKGDRLFRSLDWHYLLDEAVEIEGLKIYGTPYTPTFYDWAFMEDDQVLFNRWQNIPLDTDILICHGPPYGILDKNLEGSACGSMTLRQRVFEVNPRLMVCGHIHEGRGSVDFYGRTQFVNASLLDRHYKPYGQITLTDYANGCKTWLDKTTQWS